MSTWRLYDAQLTRTQSCSPASAWPCHSEQRRATHTTFSPGFPFVRGLLWAVIARSSSSSPDDRLTSGSGPSLARLPHQPRACCSSPFARTATGTPAPLALDRHLRLQIQFRRTGQDPDGHLFPPSSPPAEPHKSVWRSWRVIILIPPGCWSCSSRTSARRW